MKENIYTQNLCDLGYVIFKLALIIDRHELTDEDKKDIIYCEKVVKQVNKKIKEKV